MKSTRKDMESGKVTESGGRGSMRKDEKEKEKVVAMEKFEHFKENIQPMRSGRSAVALASSGSSTPSHSGLSVELEMKKMEYETKLVEEEKNCIANPLMTWLEYIKWARVSSDNQKE